MIDSYRYRYFCRKCRTVHYITSNIGKKHIDFVVDFKTFQDSLEKSERKNTSERF